MQVLRGYNIVLVKGAGSGKTVLGPLLAHEERMAMKREIYRDCHGGRSSYGLKVKVVVILPTTAAVMSLYNYVPKVCDYFPQWNGLKIQYGIGGDTWNIDDSTDIAFITVGEELIIIVCSVWIVFFCRYRSQVGFEDLPDIYAQGRCHYYRRSARIAFRLSTSPRPHYEQTDATEPKQLFPLS